MALRNKIYALLNELSDLLKNHFLEEPIVYGSLGVELILDMDFDAHDIDIIVSDDMYSRQDEVTELLEKHGYAKAISPYFAFSKDGVTIEISQLSFWVTTCRFADLALEKINKAGKTYTVLALENQKRLYDYLVILDIRSPQKHERDAIKLNAINDRLLKR